jgi:uncharacterized protein YndB with AHSA1/START domain
MNVDAVQARVTHHFSASSEQVYDAWLDPELIGQWMFGPKLREEEVVTMTTDAHVGGTFSFVVRRQGMELDHIGEYLELERPRSLVFTWAVAPDPIDSSRVNIEIVPDGSGCNVTLTHLLSPEWADFVSRIEESWTVMLNALDATLS